VSFREAGCRFGFQCLNRTILYSERSSLENILSEPACVTDHYKRTKMDKSLQELLRDGGEFGTYLEILNHPHMQGKTHLGELRAKMNGVTSRVFNMTDEILAIANTVIQDLESLQQEYFTLYLKQK